MDSDISDIYPSYDSFLICLLSRQRTTEQIQFSDWVAMAEKGGTGGSVGICSDREDWYMILKGSG